MYLIRPEDILMDKLAHSGVCDTPLHGQLGKMRIFRSCFEFLQKVFLGLIDVSVFVCALGDFLVLFAPVFRQIARYLPHHRSENASKTHPKSSHDKFKTASHIV